MIPRSGPRHWRCSRVLAGRPLVSVSRSRPWSRRSPCWCDRPPRWPCSSTSRRSLRCSRPSSASRQPLLSTSYLDPKVRTVRSPRAELLPLHVPTLMFAMMLALPPTTSACDRRRMAHPDHRPDGQPLPHARPRGRVEILHSRWRRRRARPVRHHPNLHCSADPYSAGRRRDDVDVPDRPAAASAPSWSTSPLSPSYRLRRQGRPGTLPPDCPTPTRKVRRPSRPYCRLLLDVALYAVLRFDADTPTLQWRRGR